MNITFALSRKSDIDLISFFQQQEKSAASLTVAALYSYISGEKLDLDLYPITITEQDKKAYVKVRQKNKSRYKRKEKEKIIDAVNNFISHIPKGMLSVYVKGILRCVYGSIIYQTEDTVSQMNSIPSYNIVEEFEKTSSVDSDNSDVFDLFEALLD